jgi:peptidoglycan/xylan/chitin deacetylase (PgdA/CDA1 family)
MAESTRGTMVLSLDLELSWGRFDKIPVEVLGAESLAERQQIRRFLALLDHYEIPATWAIVGHLMLDGCARDRKGHAHSETLPHAQYSWYPRDWYSCDPCTNVSLAPGWYGPDILEWIRAARVHHEIGSHSFAHILFGDPECSASAAEADIKAAVEAAACKGITLNSFVFPRNQVGHLETLRRLGISAYRGSDAPAVGKGYGLVLKPVNLLRQVLALPMKPVRPEEILPGLWNIPGNHFFLPRKGIRKILPRGGQALRAKRCIDKAVRTGRLYHMWFHPFDLLTDSDAMFSGLETVFAHTRRLREKGLLDVLTMEDYARRLDREKYGVPPEPGRSTGSSPDRESSHEGTPWCADQRASFSRQSHDCSL